MSNTVKAGWLKDKNGDKFAPKTLTSQVQTNDGTLLEDKIQSDLDTKQDKLDFDTAPKQGGTNPITSGGVYDALQGISPGGGEGVDGVVEPNPNTIAKRDETGHLKSKHGLYDDAPMNWDLLQDTEDLIFGSTVDHVITQYDAVDIIETNPSVVEIRKVLNEGHSGLVNFSGTGLTVCDIDTDPIPESTNPITSGGVHDAINSIGIPAVTPDDAGKFLRVSSEGKFIVDSIPDIEEVAF